MDSKFKAVKGKLPTKVELAKWTPEQFVTFLQFVSFFIAKTERTSKLSVTGERWKQTEEFMLMPEHPFQEHLYRIDRFYFDEKASAKMFYFRLLNYIRMVLGYIHKNPSVVSDSMREFMEKEEKFSWALQQTQIVETNAGVDVLIPSTSPMQTGGPASAAQHLHDAMVNSANLLNRLAKSITQKDINEMGAKDRIMAIGRLSFVFNLGKVMSPNQKILQQININTSSREEMEAALLQYNKQE